MQRSVIVVAAIVFVVELAAVAVVLFHFPPCRRQVETSPPPPPPPPMRASAANANARLLLDLAMDSLVGLTHRTTEKSVYYTGEVVPLKKGVREYGTDWPMFGLSMIGRKRMMNVEWAIREVVVRNVEGDFIECGVWRGGASIFARMVLNVLGQKNRTVFLADSFDGLPPARTSADNDAWSKLEYLKVSLETVKTNFEAYRLSPSEGVVFCKGYFVHALPACPVKKLAVLRLDGDMYESTMDELFNLYGKLSVGGIVIIDDWIIDVARKAVTDFFAWHGMTEEIVPIDGTGVYWVKQRHVALRLEKYAPLLPRAT